MSALEGHPRADAVIDTLAAGQLGVVTRRQLLQAGMSRHLLDHRVKAGRLCVVYAGVYRVGPIVAPRAREMAAVLACNATVSHRTAGALSTLVPAQRDTDPVDVTLRPNAHCGRRPGIRAHRSDLMDDEITTLDGIPVTSVPRTLLDLSSIATPRELERALAIAERMNGSVHAEVQALLKRYAGRSGTRRLRQILQGSGADSFTRSDAEELLLALVRRGGLPEPQMNVTVQGHEVDCFWKKARLVVEVDGYAYHGSARAFVRDRQRDSALAAAGFHVVRVTWHQLKKESTKTLVHLAQALARAGS